MWFWIVVVWMAVNAGILGIAALTGRLKKGIVAKELIEPELDDFFF